MFPKQHATLRQSFKQADEQEGSPLDRQPKPSSCFLVLPRDRSTGMHTLPLSKQ